MFINFNVICHSYIIYPGSTFPVGMGSASGDATKFVGGAAFGGAHVMGLVGRTCILYWDVYIYIYIDMCIFLLLLLLLFILLLLLSLLLLLQYIYIYIYMCILLYIYIYILLFIYIYTYYFYIYIYIHTKAKSVARLYNFLVLWSPIRCIFYVASVATCKSFEMATFPLTRIYPFFDDATPLS